MTIRLRLTLFYTLLLAITLALFSVVLFATLAYVLREQVDRDLAQREAEVQAAILTLLANDGSQLPLAAIETTLLHDEEGLFTRPGIFVRLLDPAGRVVVHSPNLDPSVPRPAWEPPAVDQVSLQTVPWRDQRVRLLSTPLVMGGRLIGVVQVGQSLAPIDLILERLALLLVAGTLLATGLVAWLGHKMAGRALAPIAMMSATARGIVENRDLETRLPVVNVTDELGHLAATLNDILDQIALLFQAQRRFMADAAHELRTPLTSIRGYTALLRRGAAATPEARNEALGVIDAEAARLTRLVNDLLLLAQTDSGPLDITSEPVALIEVVAGVLRQERLLAPTHYWTLERRATPIVRGDADRLRQLCLNLLDNARRHTPPGTHIRVTLDSDETMARLTVADDGPGIPPEAIPYLFEPFYRADRARRGGGTGLGLAIAQRIATAHGGSLTAANDPAGGACFTVCLPLMTLDSEDEDDPFQMTPGAGGPPAAPRREA